MDLIDHLVSEAETMFAKCADISRTLVDLLGWRTLFIVM